MKTSKTIITLAAVTLSTGLLLSGCGSGSDVTVEPATINNNSTTMGQELTDYTVGQPYFYT